MKHIKAFILGALSILVFIPVIESVTEIICTLLEYVRGLVSKPVLKVNKELMDLNAEQEPISTPCMGFEYTPQEEYYYEDDFEDKNTNKVKCGFR